MNISKSKESALILSLIIITILAILFVLNLAANAGKAAEARDARRRADIDQIFSTIQANDTSDQIHSSSINPNSFSAGIIPTDPDNSHIVYEYSSPATLAPSSKWSTTPTKDYLAITANGEISIIARSYRVCAWLETSQVAYCRINQQGVL